MPEEQDSWDGKKWTIDADPGSEVERPPPCPSSTALDAVGVVGKGIVSPFGMLSMRVAGPAAVTLNVYDAVDHYCIAGANALLRVVGTGVFHAGVEVFGEEWSFGCVPGPNSSGIVRCAPRSSAHHKYRESVSLGHTCFTQGETHDLITELASAWPAYSYDLLRRNCCHFCDALSVSLGVGQVPRWVLSLACIGDALLSPLEPLIGTAVYDDADSVEDLVSNPFLTPTSAHGSAREQLAGNAPVVPVTRLIRAVPSLKPQEPPLFQQPDHVGELPLGDTLGSKRWHASPSDQPCMPCTGTRPGLVAEPHPPSHSGAIGPGEDDAVVPNDEALRTQIPYVTPTQNIRYGVTSRRRGES